MQNAGLGEKSTCILAPGTTALILLQDNVQFCEKITKAGKQTIRIVTSTLSLSLFITRGDVD